MGVLHVPAVPDLGPRERGAGKVPIGGGRALLAEVFRIIHIAFARPPSSQ